MRLNVITKTFLDQLICGVYSKIEKSEVYCQNLLFEYLIAKLENSLEFGFLSVMFKTV